MVYVVMQWERYHIGAQGEPLQETDRFGRRVEIDKPINDAKTNASFVMKDGVYGNELEYGGKSVCREGIPDFSIAWLC